MRFIETVSGKFLHQVENLYSQLAIHSLGASPILENLSMPRHFLRIFLAHCTPQHIGAAQRVPRQNLGDLHHLFLVENDPVGGLQYQLQRLVLVLGIRIGDFLTTMFAIDKVVHHARLKGAGTEQSQLCNDIFKAIGLQPLDQLFHAT